MAMRTGSVTRERWRNFLRNKERMKHQKYDVACKAASWTFLPLAMGTWGGMGPEGARTFQRILKRAACWFDGDLRAVRQEELRRAFGLSVTRKIWQLLDAKNLVC